MTKIHHFLFTYPLCVFRDNRPSLLAEVMITGKDTVDTSLQPDGATAALVKAKDVRIYPLQKQQRFIRYRSVTTRQLKSVAKEINHAIEAHVLRHYANIPLVLPAA